MEMLTIKFLLIVKIFQTINRAINR